jgi:formylglycine-generating enzyme required for sulfatase activity
MSGNVDEWCWDWYGNYTEDPKTNPTGSLTGNTRTIRGGNWDCQYWFVYNTSRYFLTPSNRFDDLGFRIVRGLLPLNP